MDEGADVGDDGELLESVPSEELDSLLLLLRATTVITTAAAIRTTKRIPVTMQKILSL